MLEAPLAFLAGLLIGSFLNVCIHRLPNDLSVITPARSYCPRCKHTIAWYDNVPLASFVALRGRCRHCGERISARYPVVELLTALMFLAIVLGKGASLDALKLCVFAALNIGLLFSDLEERILPDEFTLGGTLIGLAFAPFVPIDVAIFTPFLPAEWSPAVCALTEAALGTALAGGLLWFVRAVYFVVRKKEGMGLGDLKMIAMIGAFLGLFGALQTVILASVGGSVIGLAYIWVTRKQASSYELPFGTFLGAAALLAVLLRANLFTSVWSWSG